MLAALRITLLWLVLMANFQAWLELWLGLWLASCRLEKSILVSSERFASFDDVNILAKFERRAGPSKGAIPVMRCERRTRRVSQSGSRTRRREAFRLLFKMAALHLASLQVNS